MKHIIYPIAAIAMTFCISSCAMKDEIWETLKPSQSTLPEGKLVLGVVANEPQHTRAGQSTDDFYVQIKGTAEVSDVVRTYDAASEMNGAVTLPIGTYSVEAHSPGELLRQMSSPYYKGESTIEILPNVKSEAEVECKMANSLVSVTISDEFKAKFKSWDITVNDGSGVALAFTQTSDMTEKYYINFEDNTTVLYVNVNAVTQEGQKIVDSRTYTKQQSDTQYDDGNDLTFSGGEAINVTFLPEADKNGHVTGVAINTNILFTATNGENVTIVVNDKVAEITDDDNQGGNDNPGGDSNGDITVTYTPSQLVTIAAGTDSYPAVSVDFAFKNGLQNLYVYVNSNNADFQKACDDMAISGMDLTSDAAADLGAIFTLPTVGATTYTFTMGGLIWSMLSAYGAGEHSFTLEAVDATGNTANGVLTIKVE